MNKGFHQLLLAKKSRYIACFVTHLGLFQYKRLTMGINAAAEIFHNEIADMVKDIPGVYNLHDDIIVGTVGEENHIKSLKMLHDRMVEYNVTANANKCIFMSESLDFYGNTFSAKGISTDKTKVEAIKNAPEPKDKKELREVF